MSISVPNTDLVYSMACTWPATTASPQPLPWATQTALRVQKPFPPPTANPNAAFPVKYGQSWSPTSTYSPGSIVSYNGVQYYLAKSTSSINETPSSSSTSPWVPFFSPTTAYDAGARVYIATRVYMAASAIAAGTPAPAATVSTTPATAITGWIPAYEAASFYALGRYVFANSAFFYAASAISAGTAPALGNKTGTGWLPVHSALSSFAVGDHIYHAQTNTTYLARNATNLTTHPAVQNSTGDGWIPVHSSETYRFVAGNYVYRQERW